MADGRTSELERLKAFYAGLGRAGRVPAGASLRLMPIAQPSKFDRAIDIYETN